MSNLEERRVSFDQGPKPPNLIQAAAAAAQKAPSPDPSKSPILVLKSSLLDHHLTT